MKRYYNIAFAEAFYLVQNRVVLSALHCLFAACVVIPFYVLFQISLAVGMFPLWVSGKIRGR
jgi:hypothetical protein